MSEGPEFESTRTRIQEHMERHRTSFWRGGKAAHPVRYRKELAPGLHQWVAGSYFVEVSRSGAEIFDIRVFPVDPTPERLPVGPAWNPKL